LAQGWESTIFHLVVVVKDEYQASFGKARKGAKIKVL
jgi:hypothetical protein